LVRIGESLKGSTSRQVEEYKSKFEVVKGFYDAFLKFMIVRLGSVDVSDVFRKFFGCDRVEFAAIDGSRFSDSFFDIVVFYGGAYASLGCVEIRNGVPVVTYYGNLVSEGQGISSCVPMYINRVQEVDQTFFVPEGESEEEGMNLVRVFGDEYVVENSRIADFIMHFAEYFLAYSLLMDKNRNIRIVLFDRSLSGDQAGLIASTSKKWCWDKKASIVGFEIDGHKITVEDLEYCRYRLLNDKLGIPPSRGDYLRYAVMYLLENVRSLSLEEICERLGVDSDERKERLVRVLGQLETQGFVEKVGNNYMLTPHLRNSWDAIKKLVVRIGNQLFYEESNVGMPNKLLIKKNGKLCWITSLDLSFLTLFCLYMVIEEAWKRNILLIGLTKDTSARDFKNHTIPLCYNKGILQGSIPRRELSSIPDTDRMMLQAVSLLNYDKLTPPWVLIEYDSAFSTMVPDPDSGPDFARGAIRNKISPERIFLRSYIQLLASENDPKLRSNVFRMDRLVYPEWDYREDTVINFKNKYGGVVEPVNVIVFRNKDVKNELQHLCLSILAAMTESNIPEMFGYNKPLFIADKVAKWHAREAGNIVKSIRLWVQNNPELRDFVFYMSTFRERRGKIERYRGG